MTTVLILVGILAVLAGGLYLTKGKGAVKDTLDLNKDGEVNIADAVLVAETVKTSAKAAKTTAKSTVTKARNNRRKKKSAN